MKVTILVGNPKPASRTLQVAQVAVQKLVGSVPLDLTVIDLAEHSVQLFDWPSEPMSELTATVAESDLLVIATPTYKASYTGLLKSFLDRYPANGLRGVTAIPVMTGADLTHSMGADVNLRPLLVELGASVPTRSLYFLASQMDQLETVVGEWAAETADRLSRLSPFLAAVDATRQSAVSTESIPEGAAS